VYPAPRFEEPIVMHPDNFVWIPAADGFENKRMGSFGERGLEMGFLRGRPGARHVADSASFTRELLFLLRGRLRLLPSNDEVDPETAWRFEANDAGAAFEVIDDAEIFAIKLPYFGDTARSA